MNKKEIHDKYEKLFKKTHFNPSGSMSMQANNDWKDYLKELKNEQNPIQTKRR